MWSRKGVVAMTPSGNFGYSRNSKWPPTAGAKFNLQSDIYSHFCRAVMYIDSSPGGNNTLFTVCIRPRSHAIEMVFIVTRHAECLASLKFHANIENNIYIFKILGLRSGLISGHCVSHLYLNCRRAWFAWEPEHTPYYLCEKVFAVCCYLRCTECDLGRGLWRWHHFGYSRNSKWPPTAGAKRLTTHNTAPIVLHVLWPIRLSLPAFFKWKYLYKPIYFFNHHDILCHYKK